jgi:hypothetical protein
MKRRKKEKKIWVGTVPPWPRGLSNLCDSQLHTYDEWIITVRGKREETQSQQNRGEKVWILKIRTMSSTATATATVIGSFSTTPALNRTSTTTFAANFTSRSFPSTQLLSSSNNHLLLFFKLPHTSKRSPISRRFNRFSPVMEWQDCT